jgi:hypothetical protein
MDAEKRSPLESIAGRVDAKQVRAARPGSVFTLRMEPAL